VQVDQVLTSNFYIFTKSATCMNFPLLLGIQAFYGSSLSTSVQSVWIGWTVW